MNYENKQQEEKKEFKKTKRTTSKSLTIETLSQTEDEKGETHTRDCFETLRMLKATNHTLSRWGNGYKKGDITSCISTIYRRQKLLGNIRNGIFIPLKFSTILKETNTIWNEMLRDKSIGIK